MLSRSHAVTQPCCHTASRAVLLTPSTLPAGCLRLPDQAAGGAAAQAGGTGRGGGCREGKSRWGWDFLRAGQVGRCSMGQALQTPSSLAAVAATCRERGCGGPAGGSEGEGAGAAGGGRGCRHAHALLACRVGALTVGPVRVGEDDRGCAAAQGASQAQLNPFEACLPSQDLIAQNADTKSMLKVCGRGGGRC